MKHNFKDMEMIPKIDEKIDYFATDFPKKKYNHTNPIETLSLEDIERLQVYLEHLKRKKLSTNTPTNKFTNMPNLINQKNVTKKKSGLNILQPDPQYVFGTVDSSTARKRSLQNFELGKINNYYNPYEYGARQNSIGQLCNNMRIDLYDFDSSISKNNSSNIQEIIPYQMRNINVENLLSQRNITKTPGQRSLMEKEINRFELLPFNPQDPRHIIWEDGMPRGGYATRTERLEY
jgi:hypothetical protein